MLGLLLGLIDLFDSDLVDYNAWRKDAGIEEEKK